MRLTREQWEELAATLIVVAAVLPGGLFFGEAKAADLPRDALRYQRDLTRSARQAWGLNAPVATFAAQIHQESRWRADAVSPVGAQGMAQFMPATAKWIAGAYPALAGDQPTNPVWALRALVTYDRWLWERVPGPNCERMATTLRAYNGGLGYVQREARTGKPCTAFRSAAACEENLAYPRLILQEHEPRYIAAGWGQGSCA